MCDRVALAVIPSLVYVHTSVLCSTSSTRVLYYVIFATYFWRHDSPDVHNFARLYHASLSSLSCKLIKHIVSAPKFIEVIATIISFMLAHEFH